MRVAVIGSGISGMSCAWLLARHANERCAVTLFEKAGRLGGHTHTVDVTLDGVTHPVDTGFLVYNDWTYPNLIEMFRHLGIESAPSDMSFGIKLLGSRGEGRLEWCGSNDIRSVFAQPSNLLSPRFWNMLRELLRFNREAMALVGAGIGDATRLQGTLGEFLGRRKFSREFRDWYLKPMAACIWSTPTRKIDDFPLATFLAFCRNHGLISVNDRPQWRTVKGGARQYLARLAAELPDVRLNSNITRIRRSDSQVVIQVDGREQAFDQLVFACHSDEARELIADHADAQSLVLAEIPYQANVAVLHTDRRLLPDRPRAWAAWNYMAWHPEAGTRYDANGDSPVSLSYLINRLQPLPFKSPVIVTLNPLQQPEPDRVIQTIRYDHPVFLSGSARAKRTLRSMQGLKRTWFAGAWTRYGFHEDGLMSGIAVAKALGASVPWPSQVPAADDFRVPYPGVDA
ncbi:MAG TPA: FAD-dependent oxidoreductase [Usitatibacteraceae bacterium]|nr:FAD-dependent oxidoreductase [Usitatibacteraceae bacterium]